MRSILLIFLLLFIQIGLYSQESSPKKQLDAVRVSEAPKIDGNLDDPAWISAPIATDFIQSTPTPGNPASEKTEVKILYDDVAIYIGAYMHDVAGDSIFKSLSNRDELNNSSWFGIVIDSYQDGVNGVGFITTPYGVYIDTKYSGNGEDFNWNAVWKTEARIVEDGWIVEMKIPFSALRFPKQEEQTWTVNFGRRIQRKGEQLWWSPLNPEISGFFNQAGELNGIKNIESPFRLFLFPYVSGVLEHFPYDDPDLKNTTNNFNLGMDIKYGINDAFTLDMTLVPDFGQAQSDNQVLNLSPFEVQFDENRQFFTEGTELFSKAGLFYSRRVGGSPVRRNVVSDELKDHETIKSNPRDTRLLNSTKVSGRTKGGMGIGVFNAISAPTHAVVQDSISDTERKILTDPLTNYNVFVLDQSLPNNSFLSLVNTNVWRDGNLPEAYEANVSAVVYDFNTKGNKFGGLVGGALSQKYTDGFNSPDLGYAHVMRAGKQSGNFQYNAWHEIKSKTYDINDLGFQRRNNIQNYGGGVRYNFYKGFGKKVRAQYNGLRFNYNRLMSPNLHEQLEIIGYSNIAYNNFWQQEVWFFSSPDATFDHYEARTEGQYYRFPKVLVVGGWINSDSRKRFTTNFEYDIGFTSEKNRVGYNFGVRPKYQLSERLTVGLEMRYSRYNNEKGYVNKLDNDDIIFGRRTVNVQSNVLTANYIFNRNMAINLRMRHYWSSARYFQYYQLLEDGNLTERPDYSGLNEDNEPEHDANYNAFNIDLAYTWQFLPGSELSLVWKNAILDYDNTIVKGYFPNLGNTVTSDQTNNISLKILFFVDALYFKKNEERKATRQMTN